MGKGRCVWRRARNKSLELDYTGVFLRCHTFPGRILPVRRTLVAAFAHRVFVWLAVHFPLHVEEEIACKHGLSARGIG